MTDAKREASRATLEALAEKVSLYAEMFTSERAERRIWPDEILPLVAAYRAETAPQLRSLAEVNAEIVQVVRECYRTGNLAWLGEDLTGLCRELALPELERCPQCLCVGHHQKPCHPDRPPIGVGLAVCPCDASQRLHGYLRDLLELYDSEDRSWGQVAGVLGRWRGGQP